MFKVTLTNEKRSLLFYAIQYYRTLKDCLLPFQKTTLSAGYISDNLNNTVMLKSVRYECSCPK